METEMKLQAKKEWKTPELIVLVRSQPEEAVLSGCKTAVLGGAYVGFCTIPTAPYCSGDVTS